MPPHLEAGLDARAEIEQLIGRVSLGDRAAFQTLYSRTHAKLFGICLRILNNRQDAEEALQEIFVKIWHRSNQYRQGVASPMSWLITLARNHALDMVRGRKPVNDDLDVAQDLASADPSPEDQILAMDQNRQIETCMEELEPQRADAVRLAYLDGHTYQDLADRFNVPLNTMKTWLRRSLGRLKECLSQ